VTLGRSPDHALGPDCGAIDAQGRATRIVMQVHDELVFEVPETEVEWVTAAVPALMAGVAQFSVPLLAEVGVGPNWDQAH